jgi:hypothetical protein
MKINYYIIIAFTLLLLTACEDVMQQEVDFDVKVEAADFLQFADTAIIAPVGSKITFNFEGEPDFISFSYERFLPTNATLKFATQAAWGTSVENTLQVLVSESFGGLTYRLVNNQDSVNVPVFDFDKDSINVSTHEWVDISALCNLPAVANQKREAAIPMNDYRGKNLVIAFRYKTVNATDWQPSWTISDLMID